MKNRILAFSLVVLFAFIGTSCKSDDENYPGYSNVVANFETQTVTINAGDTYSFDIYDIFENATTGSDNDIPIEITKCRLGCGNNDIATVTKNTITAVSAGKTYITCELFSKAAGCSYGTTVTDTYLQHGYTYYSI